MKVPMSNADMFLDYFNNFLSVEGFAESYGFSMPTARMVIDEGRVAHEARVAKFRVEAAAPEMLEALERVRDTYVAIASRHGVILDFRFLDDVIAKARGTTPSNDGGEA